MSVTSTAINLAASILDLRKDYVLSGETVHALRGVSFDVPEGDYISIMGPSGSGKSTLLNLLGCLDRPTAGSYLLGGDDVARMSDDQLSITRATRIGFWRAWWDCRSGLITVPRSFPAANSSAWRSPAA
jgi:putative ABC transport system ATP-binding protein